MKTDYDHLNDILEGFIPGEKVKTNIVPGFAENITPITPTAKLTLVELRLTSISKKLDTLIAQYDRARDVTAKSHLELFKDDIDKLIEL